MNVAVHFELPAMWFLGLPLGALLGWAAWRQRRRGLARWRVVTLLGLRALPLVLLLFLAARPVRVSREWVGPAARPVVILVDRSESMSLKEPEATRYERALDFLRRRLLPALESAQLTVQGMVFDQTTEAVTGTQMASAKPQGKRTNLGGAVAQALSGAPKPLAVIALTDGIANEIADDARAMGMLADSGVPFIGVGFGNDEGVQTICLRRLEAPISAPPKTSFSISAELEMVNAAEPAGFDLVLFRDGQVLQKKTLKLGTGSRSWVESFQVNEAAQGVHNYSVQLLTPNLGDLKCVNTQAGTS